MTPQCLGPLRTGARRADRSTQQKLAASEGRGVARQQPAHFLQASAFPTSVLPKHLEKMMAATGAHQSRSSAGAECHHGDTATSTRRLSLQPTCTRSRCPRDVHRPWRRCPAALTQGSVTALQLGGLQAASLFLETPRGWPSGMERKL